MWLEKGNLRDACGDGDVLYLDCVNVNILIAMSYYSCVRCYQSGKLGPGYRESFCMISNMWITNYLKIKSLIKSSTIFKNTEDSETS